MKIAFDAQLLLNKEKTGIPWMAHNLILSMAKQSDHDFVLNVAVKGLGQAQLELLDEYVASNVTINARKQISPAMLKAYRAASSLLPIPYQSIFGKADITHFFNYSVPCGTSGPVVTTVCDMAYKAYPETVGRMRLHFLNTVVESSIRRADRIVTISDFSRSEIMQYTKAPRQKLIVVPCAVDRTIYHRNHTKSEVTDACEHYKVQKPYFLYVGTLEPRKNLERLLEGYALSLDIFPDMPQLVIAGRKGWLYDTIFEKTNMLGLGAKVVFSGYIAPKDVPRLMAGAEAFLYPSLYEGFGMPPLEAAACGTPVIVSNAASMPEVMGDAALYVDPFEPKTIADAILRLAQTPELANKLVQKGIERANAFEWDCSARQILDMYEALFRERKHG